MANDDNGRNDFVQLWILLITLQLIMVGLKMSNAIQWSWIWIFWPIYLGIILFVGFCIGFCVVMGHRKW